jgi:hypothetical protein
VCWRVHLRGPVVGVRGLRVRPEPRRRLIGGDGRGGDGGRRRRADRIDGRQRTTARSNGARGTGPPTADVLQRMKRDVGLQRATGNDTDSPHRRRRTGPGDHRGPRRSGSGPPGRSGAARSGAVHRSHGHSGTDDDRGAVAGHPFWCVPGGAEPAGKKTRTYEKKAYTAVDRPVT